MKLRLPKRRIWRVAIYIVSTLLILVALDLILVRIGRHIPHDYATTHITEPTLPDGQLDYLTALESHYNQGVTPQNNAVVALLEAVGPIGLPNPDARSGIIERLGMPPLADKADYLQERDKFPTDGKVGENQTDDLPPLMERPWKASQYPHSADWLKANEKPLAKIIEASKRPRFFYPLYGRSRPETLAGCLLPYLAITRHAANTLVARAMLRAGEGDIAGAHEDLMAAHRIADLLSQAPTLIDRLVAYAIDTRASEAEQMIAAANLLTTAQARQWLKTVSERAELNSFVDAIDIAERYMFLDCLQFGAHHGLKRVADMISTNPPGGPPIFWDLLPIRFGRAMRVGNDWYDRLIAACKQPSRAQRRAAAKALMQEFEFARANQSSMRLGHSDWPIVLFLPGLGKVVERDDRAFTNRVIAQTALALAVHHAEHGAYPATLPDLPPDPFSDKPLIYKTTPRGYVLYSVGPNGRDEQGKGDDLPLGGRPDATIGLDALNL